MIKPWHDRRGCIRMARAKRRSGGAWLALALALAPVPALAQQPMENVASAIRGEASGKQIKAFYKARNYWPLWVQDGTIGPEADRLIALIETSAIDGLRPRNYDIDGLSEVVERARKGNADELARAELRLSRTFADYVRDMRGVRPARMTYVDRELVPVRPDELVALRSAAVAPSLADYLDKMGWMSPFYAQLRGGLADYLSEWADLPQLYIPEGPALKPGTKGDRVEMLRTRLGLPQGSSFDKVATARLRRFQAAHGLPVDGVAGAKTIAALNRGPGYYQQTIELNLERARALPAGRDRYIVVDAASARLWAFEDGEVVETMKVVVGKPATPTPMMAGTIRYAILTPYWNVPPDLVASRIAPKVLKGATLESMGYEALSDWGENAQVLSNAEIDWQAVADGRQELRVRQFPSGDNAMGKVKFMFPNDQGIYLHDTPDKQLMKKVDRHFSNGCVRLEDADRLGQWLLGKPIDGENGDPEQVIALTQPVPVYLTYLTAVPEETGIAFRADTYNRDDGTGSELLAAR